MVENTLPHLEYLLQEEQKIALRDLALKLRSLENDLCKSHMRSALVRKSIDEILSRPKEAEVKTED